MKIDILEGYVWTPEWFRMSSGIYQSIGGLPEPPGSVWALLGHSGREEEAARWRAAPQAQSKLGGGPAPLSFPLSPPSFLSYSNYGRGNPTPTGSRISPFLVELGALPCSRSRREGKGREKGRKEGVRPLPLVQFGLGLGGRAACPRQPLSLSRMAQ